MASNIKDIKVNISGDASALKASLKGVNDEVGKTQRELSNVERLLKMDPGNMDLLREKQVLLTNSIQDTKTKLEALKEAKKSADEEGIKNTEQGAKTYNELINQIAATEIKLNSLEKTMSNFGSVHAAKIASIGDEFKNVGDKIEDAGKKMAGFSAAAAGVIATGVAYNAQMQKYETAITTLTGSAEEAESIMNQIKQDASTTPFDVSGLTSATQLLLSTGLSAEEARGTILALGDAISATGGGDAELSRMAVNLQQIKNLGKASSIDIKQFANAGIDVYGLLADYLHVSKEEAAQMTISWDDLNGALIAASQEGGKYFGAMEAQSQTFNGAVSNLKDSLGQLVGSLTESLMPIITQVVQKISQLAEWFKNLSPETQSLISTILLLVAALSPVLILIGQLTTGIGSIMTFAPMIMTAITAIGGFITTTLIPAVSTLFTLLMANPIGLIVAAIAGIIAAIVALWNNCEWFRNGVMTVFEWFKSAFTAIGEFFANIFGGIWERIKAFYDFIHPISQAITDWLASKIVGVFDNFKTYFKAYMDLMVAFIQDPIGTIKEIFQTLLPKIYEWALSMVQKVKDGFKKIVEVGKYIVEGIWNGILNAKDWLLNKIKSFASTITDGIKSFFGIESPSKVMRDEVGKYLAQGIGVGFDREMTRVISDMTATARQITDAISTELDVNAMPHVKNAITSQNYYTTKSYSNTTEVVKQPSNVTLVMDKKKLGEIMVPVMAERNKVLGVSLS